MEDIKKEELTIPVSKVSSKIHTILLEQVNHEYKNSRIYLCMQMFCKDKSYFGAEKYFAHQVKEEQEHGDGILEYLIDKKMPFSIPPTEKISPNYSDLVSLLYEALQLEKNTTDSWKKIAQVCMEEKDYQTFHFAQHYLDIQLEEEATLINFIDKYKQVPYNHCYFLDIEMGKLNQ